MAEPFRGTIKKKAKVEVPADEDVTEKTVELINEQTPKADRAPSVTPKFANISRTNVGASSNLASTSKAKKVMDWFRTKSKGKVPTDDEPSIKEKDLPSLDGAAGSSTSTVNGINVVSPNSGSEGPIPKPSIPNHPHRTPSIATDRSFTNMVKNVVAPSQGPKNVLRVHHGAVDQDTITSGSPPEDT
jgi:protein-serine/threonine kinase